MEIETLSKCELKLPSGAVQSFPAGWTGEVDDATGLAWIEAGKARAVIVTGGTLTPVETAVLKSAAQQIISQQQTEELVRLQAELAEMTVAELRELAAAHGVALADKARKADIIVALVADAQAKAAQTAATAPAA